MFLRNRADERWECPNGDVWDVRLVEYDSTTTKGGKDIVLQLKKNGSEVGHVTEHYDSSWKLMKTNYHPIGFNSSKAIPSSCKRIN
jgi:hypothetical protein